MRNYNRCDSDSCDHEGGLPDPQLPGTGLLRIRTYAARNTDPIAGITVRIFNTTESIILAEVVTDDTGIYEYVSLDCPPAALSLDEGNTLQPYSTYNLIALGAGYEQLHIRGVQMFDGEITMAELALIPIDEEEEAAGIDTAPEEIDIPPHSLFAGSQSSGRSPIEACPVSRILTEVIIPKNITVHLGKPSANVKNVTVSFRDYIKNVASSEVYPTWPEQYLRANIHAQISLAINRIYTEWYKSKGFPFQISSSPGYDQYYVHGRTIFEVMSRITDDIFNTYVRKIGTINPFFTEYCDGKTVTCPGMKQWGSKTLAEQGRNALSILNYYYKNNVEIVRTNNIASIPESYPGTPLRLGSTGNAVRTIQSQLNRITRDYPFFGKLVVTGVFDAATVATVKKFQKQFSLPQDGVVGRTTWYKISYIYVSVKDLAELTSEGEKPNGNLVDGVYPGTALRLGSRGSDVQRMQFWLQTIAKYISAIPTLSVDGTFGPGTDASVRAFQRHFQIPVDGVVGAVTWDRIYREYNSLQSDSGGALIPGAFPGTTLRLGDRNDNVRQFQFYLGIIARSNSAIPAINADGIFGAGTQAAVRAFQSFYGLAVDGAVGKLTWNKIYEVYTDLSNNLLNPTERPGTYPGTPLRMGSSGRVVKELQYYLYLFSAYYSEIPRIAYDGQYGTGTANAVRAYQQLFGLTVDGVVGRATWDSIYGTFQKLRNVDGPVQAFYLLAYPGYDLMEGAAGAVVSYVQFLLSYIGYFYDEIMPITAIDGVFGEETRLAVESFERQFKFPITGVVNKSVWDAMVIVYLALASEVGEEENTTGEYPGYVLSLGSAGQNVRLLQTYMNAIAARFCVVDFVPDNGIFDAATADAVRLFQRDFGLPITGVVDRATWDFIYSYYQLEE